MKTLVTGFAVLLIACALFGCASYRPSDYELSAVETRLPALIIADDGANELVLRDLRTNIFELPSEQDYGIAVVRSTSSASAPMDRVGNRLLTVVSGLTLGMLNILGMPFGSVPGDAEVEVVVYDSDLQRVGTYKTHGKGTAYVAFYYGYNDQGAQKAAEAKAVTDAIEELRSYLQRDASDLAATLHSSGPIAARAIDSAIGRPGWGSLQLDERQAEAVDEFRTQVLRNLEIGLTEDEVISRLSSFRYADSRIQGITGIWYEYDNSGEDTVDRVAIMSGYGDALPQEALSQALRQITLARTAGEQGTPTDVRASVNGRSDPGALRTGDWKCELQFVAGKLSDLVWRST